MAEMKVFGPFRLDAPDHSLWRAGSRVRLTPKAFDLLAYLVDHAGRLVTQDELLDSVWPRAVVNVEAVKKQILGIRRALGDSAERPVFIETVARRGYRFIAPVSDASTATRPPPYQATTNLVGRAVALSELDARLCDVLLGRRQVVFVTGEAGIGKTTLLDHFHVRSHGDIRFARGQCVEGFGGKEPYYPVFEALGSLLREGEGSPFAQLLGSHAPTWLAQFPALITPERRPALEADIMGATRERMVRELCEVLEAWTTAHPLALALEDLQWADASTVELLSALARRRDAARLLVIGTFRPIDAAMSNHHFRTLEQDLLIHDLCHEIALHGLEAGDIALYLQVAFPDLEGPAEFAGILHRHSSGNALFLREILRELVKRGILLESGGAWRLSCPVSEVVVGVPSTLQQMIVLQFERLAAQEQRVLRVASACGQRFVASTIASALELPVEDVEETCEALAASGRFITRAARHGLGEEGADVLSDRYEFTHVMYGEAIYARLAEAARARLHRLVGMHLKARCDAGHAEIAAEVAMHLQRAGEHAGAVEYLVLAADNAMHRFAYRDAVRTLQDALALLRSAPAADRVERELQILQRVGDMHYWLGEMSESCRAYESQARVAAEAGLVVAEMGARERLLMPLGFIDPDAGVAQAQTSERRCAELGDELLLAHARMRAAGYRCVYDRWREDDWQRWLGAAAHVRSLSDAPLPPYLLSLQRYLMVLRGEHREALRDIRTTQRAGSEEGTRSMLELLATSALTVSLLRCGQLGELLRIVRTGQELAARNGSDPWLFVLREAWLRSVLMDHEGAQRLCAEQLARPMHHPASQLRTIGLVAQGHVHLEHRRHDDALAAFSEAREPARTGKFFLHWLWRAEAHRGVCEALLDMRELVAARRESELLLEAALSTADPHLHALALDVAARVAMADERPYAARRAIRQALDVVTRSDVPTIAWRVHATACELLPGALGSDARALALAAIERLVGTLDPSEPLRAQFLLAAAVRRIVSGATGDAARG